MRAAVVVPVKSFALAKERLSSVLSEHQRAALARWCAARVLAAAAPLEPFVACDDAGVAQWARSVGATPLACSPGGLNVAATDSLEALRVLGFDVAVIAHGDLPLARRVDHVAMAGVVSAVPDRRGDGTNVLAVPTALAGEFKFQYGRGSFPRHVREALRCGVPARVLQDADLAQDLDTAADLADERMDEVRQWLRTNQASPH